MQFSNFLFPESKLPDTDGIVIIRSTGHGPQGSLAMMFDDFVEPRKQISSPQQFSQGCARKVAKGVRGTGCEGGES